jgi:hypothetical protein
MDLYEFTWSSVFISRNSLLDSDVGVQKRETSGDNCHELTELLETLLSIM